MPHSAAWHDYAVILCKRTVVLLQIVHGAEGHTQPGGGNELQWKLVQLKISSCPSRLSNFKGLPDESNPKNLDG